MEYRAFFKHQTKRELQKLTKRDHDRVLVMISSLLYNPSIGKKLKGGRKEYYTARVWPYRILYRMYKKEHILIIGRITHHQGSYKK